MGVQFSAIANGNASNPAVWNVGVVVPGDGDTVLTGALKVTLEWKLDNPEFVGE